MSPEGHAATTAYLEKNNLELNIKVEKIEQVHNNLKRTMENFKAQQQKSQEQMRKIVSTISGIESRMDSSSFEAA